MTDRSAAAAAMLQPVNEGLHLLSTCHHQLRLALASKSSQRRRLEEVTKLVFKVMVEDIPTTLAYEENWEPQLFWYIESTLGAFLQASENDVLDCLNHYAYVWDRSSHLDLVAETLMNEVHLFTVSVFDHIEMWVYDYRLAQQPRRLPPPQDIY